MEFMVYDSVPVMWEVWIPTVIGVAAVVAWAWLFYWTMKK